MPTTASAVPESHLGGLPLIQQFGNLAEIAGRHGLPDLQRRCRTAREQLGDGVVNVAILGRFKAGKTTLLNQLLGADLLPVQAIPATAVVTRVRAGATTRALLKGAGAEPLELDVAGLSDWITESGNPGNSRHVEWVEVQSPALWDLEHLVLVDTPGTGSSWSHNTETSLDWLPNVGAALITINATQPVAEDDLRLIAAVQPHTPNLSIVLTKVDLLTDVELGEVTTHVRQQLLEHIGIEPPLLPFSIASRHRGHRDRLRAQLRQLDTRRTAAVAALAAHRADRLTAECRGYLELAATAATTHQGAITALTDAIQREMAELPELRHQLRAQSQRSRTAIQARAVQTFSSAFPKTLQLLADSLTNELRVWRGSLATETRRFRDWLHTQLRVQLAPIQALAIEQLEPLVAQGLQPAQRLGEAFVQRLGGLVYTATGVRLDIPAPKITPTAVKAVDLVFDAVFDSHLEMLSWLIPMPAVRPLVHRHFRSLLPWQVDKNMYRAAQTVSSSAVASLDTSLASYQESLTEILRTCQRIASTSPSDLPALTHDLALLDASARVGA